MLGTWAGAAEQGARGHLEKLVLQARTKQMQVVLAQVPVVVQVALMGALRTEVEKEALKTGEELLQALMTVTVGEPQRVMEADEKLQTD